MKHLFKTIFGLSIAALLTVFISCPQPIGPDGGTNPHTPSNPGTVPAVPSQTPVEKALAELTVSPLKVFSATTKVNLPTSTSVSGVTITWTAAPTDWIELADGNLGNIKQRPDSGEQNVTLTATATKGGETKTKDFTITIYPATAVPSAQDLADSLTFPSQVSQDIDLPNTVDGYPAAAITWTSADDKIIKIEDVSGPKKGIIGYDLIDKTVTLTASIHYEDGNPDTLDDAQAQFNITVTHVVKITEEQGTSTSTDEFTGSEYIKIRTDKATGKIVAGSKYTYTDVQTAIDGNNIKRTAIFTKTEEFMSNNWVTKETHPVALSLKEVKRLKGLFGDIKLEDFVSIPLLNDTSGRKAIFNSLKNAPAANNPLLAYDNFSDFDELSDTEESNKLKELLLSLETLLESANAETQKEFASYSYEYKLEKSGETFTFISNMLFRKDMAWYEQRGKYVYPSPSSNSVTNITIEIWRMPSLIINITIEKGGKTYNGYTAPGQTVIENIDLTNGHTPGDTISVTMTDITVSDNGTLTIGTLKIGDDTFNTKSLQFEGHSLQ